MAKIINRLNKITQTLNSKTLTDVAYKKFVDVTPIDTGNAKRNTKKSTNSIDANYPYAQVLDKGRGIRNGKMQGSTQAPAGMTKPTIDHLRKYIQQQTGIKLR